MAQNDADLIVQISATTELLRQQMVKADGLVSNFQRNTNRTLSRVDKDFDAAGKSVGKLHTSFKSLAAVGVASLGAAFSVDVLANFARNALETGSALSEMSEQLGVSVEDLQRFTFLGEQAGISAEEMQKALQKLTRTVGEATAGNKKASGAFAELGINIKNADGSLKSTGALFAEIAGGLEKIPDPANRARIEVALFGKAGQQLAPLLNQGAGGIAKLSAEYDKLGIALSGDQAKQLDEAADEFEKFKTKLQGKFTIWFANYAIPEIRAFVADFTKEMKNAERAYNGFKNLFSSGPAKIPATAFAPTSPASNAKALGSFSPFNAPLGSAPFTGPRTKKPFSLTRNFLPEEDFGLGTFGGSAALGPKIAGPLAGFSDLADQAFAGLDDRIATYSETIRDDISIYADEYGLIVDQLERGRDVTYQGVQDDIDLRETAIRDQAALYETLMTQGTKGFLRTLEYEGFRIIAEMAARLISGQSLNSAFSAVKTGSSLLSMFGGFFANGGTPPMGKVSVVGERGPELFVPKVPGTIIPNGGFGGGQSINLTVHAPGATAETVAMIRRELANAAPAIAAAGAQSAVKMMTRPRI